VAIIYQVNKIDYYYFILKTSIVRSLGYKEKRFSRPLWSENLFSISQGGIPYTYRPNRY